MNLPNKLTLLRIILVPVFITFLLMRGNYPLHAEILALFTFVIAAITDKLDGYFARKNEIVTKLGKIMDPLADKLLISGAFIVFVALDEISVWPAIIIIGRELAITGLRVLAASEGVVVPANKWGKWKTTLQITAIIAVIMDPRIISFPWQLPLILIWLAVLITIYSGYIYFKQSNIDFSSE